MVIHTNEIGIVRDEPIHVSASMNTCDDIDRDKVIEAVKKFRSKFDKESANKYLPKGTMDTYGIMASSVWNANDDVFTKQEISSARWSPYLKPVNEMHKFQEGSAKIIGVITSSMMVGSDYNPLYREDDINEADIVSLMITASLWEIYFPKACKKIKTSIEEKKAFLSMECVSDDFGYALKAEGSENVVLLPRNELTSHLTKSLRAYGGKGTVKLNNINYRIGRWLIGITFTGVAYVDRPADPTAVVFEDYLSHATARMVPASDEFIQEMKENIDDNTNGLLKVPVKSVSYLKKEGQILWL